MIEKLHTRQDVGVGEEPTSSCETVGKHEESKGEETVESDERKKFRDDRKEEWLTSVQSCARPLGLLQLHSRMLLYGVRHGDHDWQARNRLACAGRCFCLNGQLRLLNHEGQRCLAFNFH